MTVTVRGGTMCAAEQQAYVEEMRRHPDKIFASLTFTLDGDYVDVDYEYEPVPFERIRRITGYLVGKTTRWNAAKRAELDDRVKHTKV